MRRYELISASFALCLGACSKNATEGGGTSGEETSGTAGTTGSATETGATGTTGTGTETGSTTQTETDTGTGMDACLEQTEHLLISELAVQPAEAEFVELWNPGAVAVDLSIFYLSDNAASYHGLASGAAWAPGGTPGTDFLVGFPSGASVGAGEYLTIEFGTDFEGTYGSCPDYTVRDDVICGGNPVPKLSVPDGGGLGTSVGVLLANSGEMTVLFCWDQGELVYDADYVTWDPDATDPETRIDKSAVPGYAPDTPPAQQFAAPVPGANETVGRCDANEVEETGSGGNGLHGHDETSENSAVAFEVLSARSPGAANECT